MTCQHLLLLLRVCWLSLLPPHRSERLFTTWLVLKCVWITVWSFDNPDGKTALLLKFVSHRRALIPKSLQCELTYFITVFTNYTAFPLSGYYPNLCSILPYHLFLPALASYNMNHIMNLKGWAGKAAGIFSLFPPIMPLLLLWLTMKFQTNIKATYSFSGSLV